MEQSIYDATILILIGISTVFAILILVVVLGNLIVIITNKFAVEQISVPSENQKSGQEISSGKLAAIVATVDTLTGGKGKIISISKSKV